MKRTASQVGEVTDAKPKAPNVKVRRILTTVNRTDKVADSAQAVASPRPSASTAQESTLQDTKFTRKDPTGKRVQVDADSETKTKDDVFSVNTGRAKRAIGSVVVAKVRNQLQCVCVANPQHATATSKGFDDYLRAVLRLNAYRLLQSGALDAKSRDYEYILNFIDEIGMSEEDEEDQLEQLRSCVYGGSGLAVDLGQNNLVAFKSQARAELAQMDAALACFEQITSFATEKSVAPNLISQLTGEVSVVRRVDMALYVRKSAPVLPAAVRRMTETEGCSYLQVVLPNEKERTVVTMAYKMKDASVMKSVSAGFVRLFSVAKALVEQRPKDASSALASLLDGSSTKTQFAVFLGYRFVKALELYLESKESAADAALGVFDASALSGVFQPTSVVVLS